VRGARGAGPAAQWSIRCRRGVDGVCFLLRTRGYSDNQFPDLAGLTGQNSAEAELRLAFLDKGNRFKACDTINKRDKSRIKTRS
jgi:hypothetical protein